MTKSHTSIQKRLMVSLTIAIIALFGICAVGLYFFMRHAFYEQFDKNLMRVAEDFIHETGRNSTGEVECEFHELDLEEFRKGDFEGGAYYELWDYQGKTLIRSASLTSDESLPYHNVGIGIIAAQPIILQGKFPGRIVYTSFLLKLGSHDLADQESIVETTSLTPDEKAFVESYDKNDPENRVYLAIA